VLFHECSARILDTKGKVLKEVVEVFRHYKPLIEQKTEEIVQKRGLSKEKIDAILNPKTPISKISLVEINDIAQVVFLRPTDKERKDTQPLNAVFLPYTDKQVQSLFHRIGDITTVYPKRKHYNYILINGSTVKNMRQRLKTLVDLVNAQKVIVSPKTQIVFLTGERDLFPEEDLGQLEDPSPLKLDRHWKKPSDIPTTEAQAAQWIWYQSDLPCSMKEAKIVFVKAPKKSEVDPATQKAILKRPTTFDTIATWIKEYQPQPGSCLSISSQPYVYYQQATTNVALKKAGVLDKGFSVDATGLKANNENFAHFKDNIAIILDNFARTIYTEVQMLGPPKSSHQCAVHFT
jgi:hypothetical protein